MKELAAIITAQAIITFATAGLPETNTYREVLWTNVFDLQNFSEQLHTEVAFDSVDFNLATEDLSAAWSNDYQVIVLFQDDAVSDNPDTDQATAFTTNLNASVLSQLTASEILRWQYGEMTIPGTVTKSGSTQNTPTQIVFIEPLNSRRSEHTDLIKVHEYRLDTIPPKPEWYEWFNPRLFLNKWAGYWNSETNATPVVLVLFTF